MKRIILPAAALLLILAAGCKPTENNYKAAYDAAQQKRQASATDPDILLPAGGKLQQFDAPNKQVVDGDTYNVIKEHLKFEDGVEHAMHKWCVAVAVYKMPTNCAAQVSQLFTKGYKAFGAQNAKGQHYAIAGAFQTLKEAAAFAKEFKAKHKATDFVGLEGEPLIIER